jgi:predicted DNA-binding transcriptional regulator AlpA
MGFHCGGFRDQDGISFNGGSAFWSRKPPFLFGAHIMKKEIEFLPQDFPPATLLRVNQFCSGTKKIGILPMGISTFLRRVEEGTFPEGLMIGPRCRVWLAEDVYAIRDKIIADARSGKYGKAPGGQRHRENSTVGR